MLCSALRIRRQACPGPEPGGTWGLTGQVAPLSQHSKLKSPPPVPLSWDFYGKVLVTVGVSGPVKKVPINCVHPDGHELESV